VALTTANASAVPALDMNAGTTMAERQIMTLADVVAKTMDGRLEDCVREAVAVVARQLTQQASADARNAPLPTLAQPRKSEAAPSSKRLAPSQVSSANRPFVHADRRDLNVHTAVPRLVGKAA